MTTTDAPEPPEEVPGQKEAAQLLRRWAMSPQQTNNLKAALEKSSAQLSKDLSPAVRALLDSAKLVRIETSQVRNLDPAHPPEGETEGDVQNRLIELSTRQLEVSTEANKILKQQAETEGKRATENEKHAKTSKWVAIVSLVVALLALFGALPQGVAAIPDAWAVITGGWPPASPNP